MHVFLIILKYLCIWFVVSIPIALATGQLLKSRSEQCLNCGGNRRKAIETEGYEYFECLDCGAREAEKIGDPEIEYPLNLAWLNGKEWC